MRVFCGILVLFSMFCERAGAFSLLGPFDSWQTPDIGYGVDELDDDIGGPMNIGEEYRWNVQTITYAFDPSFVNFFGNKGVEEINKAIAILNALPRFSKMSSNLTEYPTDTLRENYRATALGIWDVKSFALSALAEELGLANPNRYVWTLRDKVAIPGGFSYQVIMRNLDPATGVYSRYVNGQLYSYIVLDPVPGFVTVFADAVEVPINPINPGPTAVAAFTAQIERSLTRGHFFTGFTRDDIGGLRYLYTKNNRNVESLLPGTLVSVGGGGVWAPVGGGDTNSAGTNALVDLALRPGVDKIIFKQVKFDSGNGLFVPVTNRYTDSYVVNNRTFKQGVMRPVNQPDILFTAGDLNRGIALRTDTTGWVNNAGTNSIGGGITGGPGVIQPPVIITLNKVGPYMLNQYSGNSFFLDEGSGFSGFVWGSFDGSTNTPFIYPADVNGNSYPIEELEQAVFLGN